MGDEFWLDRDFTVLEGRKLRGSPQIDQHIPKSERVQASDGSDIVSCNPKADLPQPELSLDKTKTSDDTELVSCNSAAILPPPELTLDKVNTSNAEELVSSDAEAYLPAGEDRPLESIAPWERREWSQMLHRKPDQSCSARPSAPDISRGLGRQQVKKDIVALAKYVQDQLTMLVRKDECNEYVLYVFDPPYWRNLSPQDAQRIILSVLERDSLATPITDREASDIYRRLLIEPHLFYQGRFEPPKGLINFQDGTYNIFTDEFYSHRPEDHFTTCVNVFWSDICQASYGNKFEDFVANLSGGDPAIRTQLLELVAIPLTGLQLKYFYVLVGESNTGKTQFGVFMTKLIGEENVKTVRDISDFSGRWTVGSLQGNLLATCLDLPDGPLPSSSVGIIKQFVGDDPIKGEKKYRDSFTFFRKPLLLLAGNHPIRLHNMAEETALLNRMVCIPFRNPIPPEEQQQQLFEELLKEAPYIIREAISAFRELAQRNFQVTQSTLPEKFLPKEGNLGVCDVLQYVQELLMFDPESECTTEDLWSDYCEIGMKYDFRPLTKIAFSRALMQVLDKFDVPVQSIKRVCGTESRGYKGLIIPNRQDNHSRISFP